MEILTYILIGIGAYLIGSISPALIISNSVAKKDVRDYGSGNAGTTNMMRTFGWKMGVLTFLLDVIKGALVAFVSRLVGGDIGMLVGCILVVAGHNWPIYYAFRGGKGVATTLGVMLVLMPVQTAILLAVVLVIMGITRIVSLGSIIGLVLEIIAVFVFYPENVYLQITVVVLSLLALIAHRKNIYRLFKGEEKQLEVKAEEKK